MEETQAYNKISSHYGKVAQFNKLEEEVDELLAEIKTTKQQKELSYNNNFIQELADVQIMIKQHLEFFDKKERAIFELATNYKLERTLLNISMEGENDRAKKSN